ncbi:ABC transporter transmembrane domain-containing protein [Paenibacillus koleovorans]|uniref:ABC transporter transmembrane domain-containing protein n=1 Tax=Paenibacillus koleovorans TaxID=121608 RepID=UPI0013E356E0|nr:ABC transporter transmembrane domain-containing protein [Paenibacillus koleovorans]
MLKTIIGYLSLHKGFSTLIGLGLLFELLFHYLIAISYKYLIDDAIMPKDAHALSIIIGVLVAVGLLNVVTGSAGDYAAAKFSNHILTDIRSRLLQHIQKQSDDFHVKYQTGDILSRYTSDVPIIETAITRSVTIGLLSVLSIVTGLVILFGMEWRLTLICLALSTLLFVPYKVLRPRTTKVTHEYQEQLVQFTSLADENLKGYRVIRGFNLGDTMVLRIRKVLDAMFTLGVRRAFNHSNLHRYPMLALAIVHAFILGYGGYLTFTDALSIGNYLAFNSLFMVVGHSFTTLTAVLPSIISGRVSLARVDEVLNYKPRVVLVHHAPKLPAISQGIQLDHVSFGYEPAQSVLKNMSLTIPARGYTVIVGASGSGKSTLLHLMLRFYDPDEGRVLYDNEDIQRFDYSSLLSQTSIVFQDTFLFNSTLSDNIKIARPEATIQEIAEAARMAEVHDTIERFPDGYASKVQHQGASLSGGQRQRVAIARALLKKPKILFLDEATSALDPDTESAVNETIRRLANNGQQAVVSVTHRLKYASQADRILVLHQGEIVEDGTHEQLISHQGIYQRMWNKQQGFNLTGNGSNATIDQARLGQLPFFAGLDPETLQRIVALFEVEKLDTGQSVVNEGDDGNKFYIIVRGRVEVTKAMQDGAMKRVALLDDGDHFGEIALLRSVPRTASIRTLTPCVLLVISGDRFLPLMIKYPQIRESLETTLRSRL